MYTTMWKTQKMEKNAASVRTNGKMLSIMNKLRSAHEAVHFDGGVAPCNSSENSLSMAKTDHLHSQGSVPTTSVTTSLA